MRECINNKCAKFDLTEERNCKRKNKWNGCKKAKIHDFDAVDSFAGGRMDGYHCASGSKAWGSEKYRNWPR